MLTSRCFPREIPEVPRARHFVAKVLADAGADASDAVLLVTSELVTNAVRYGAGLIELRVLLDESVVRVEVLDGGHATLAAPSGAPSPESVNGRGLHLVHCVSDAWGTGFDADGRTMVWAEMDARTPARPMR